MIPEQVIEIDIDNKYIIVFDDYLSDKHREIIKNDISEWLKRDDAPFCILSGGKILMIKRKDE